MRRSMMLAVVCGVLILACVGGSALFFVERPTIVRVAIPSDDHGDNSLLSAASKVVRHGHHPIRFKVVGVADAKAASASLDNGNVDMAVVRTDDVMPAQGQTVVILHRDAALLVAPGGSALKDISDLRGHTVGLLEGHGNNRPLLDTALGQYDVTAEDVKSVPVTPDHLAEAFKSKQIDAALVVGIISGSVVQETVKVASQAGEGPPVFLAVPDADAIAQRSPAYDSFEVVKGAFRGSPPQPAEEFNTLSVTHRLVASSVLGQSLVADVTRFFLSERSALVALDPIARRIEAPSTDKGTPLPAHPGTAAYIDDEEETFLDQYGDYIYMSAMFLGVLASGATAVLSRINAQGARAVEQLTGRLLEIMKLVRLAPSLPMVSALENETDEIVAKALHEDNSRGLDERCIGALGLALHQVREAIRDRRSMLDPTPQSEVVTPKPKHVVMVD
ncbi:TAXI family TRAP transporter solute-binding subunit [Lichenifustis flavocetrariae]|uniref:ABC transporter substrate-binding protein n=1 Tax=Lichenifustis flavocetrariae TaxID=2949735 RepID=A0AA41YTI0_9HYPH|nr:TAXI family TRAP transporter solute-binding subunit [Lichenifustis flavocetrariae]MCW6507035.1 ABC transporter substrate-binding protein [Lichenifustis flavocetrariae]